MAEDFLDFEIRLQLAEQDISKLNKQLSQIAQNSAKVGDQIDDSFKDANKEIKLASDNMKEFQKMSNKLSGSVSDAGNKFEQGFEMMSQSTQELRDEIYDLSSVIKNLASASQNVGNQTSSKFKEAKESISDTTIETKSLQDALKNIATGIGVTFGLAQIKSFMAQIVSVRGEFQNLEIAMETILGSKEKSNKLMQQMIQTAATTPFELKDVASGAKQLLAYGESAENVNETLIRLGNIASGLSQPLNDIVYLYGTTMTQGRLYTQDLNQFTGRGIPMIKELAKQFGVAESEVKSLVEEGKVGFPEVQKVIENLTNEGGMFFNLMEKQSKSLQGQISNLQDSFDMMLNEIGQQAEGILSGALGVIGKLVENYNKVGKAILALIGTYGTYKAVLATVIALERLHKRLIMEAALQKNLAAASNIALSKAAAMSAAKHSIMAGAVNSAKNAVRGLSASIKSLNPVAIAITAAIAALGVGIYLFKTRTDSAKISAELLNKALKETDELFQKRKQKSTELISIIQDETSTEFQKIQAFEELSKIMPKLTEEYDMNALATLNMAESNTALNKTLDNMAIDDLTNSYQKNLKQIDLLQKENDKMISGENAYNYLSFEKNAAEITALKESNKELEKEIEKRKALAEVASKPLGDLKKEYKNILNEIKTLEDNNELMLDLKIDFDQETYKDNINKIETLKQKNINLRNEIEKREKIENKKNNKNPESEEKKTTNYLEQAEEKAARMAEDNYLKRLEYEASIAKERNDNLDEYFNKMQELTDQEYEYKILAIEREREEAIKNAVGEDKDKINQAFDKQVTATQNEWQMKSNVNTKTKEKNEYTEKLKAYKEFVDEYIKITEEKNEREKEIDKLVKEGKITSQEGETRKQGNEMTAQIDQEALQQQLGLTAEEVSSMITDVVASTMAMTLGQIQEQLPILEKELASLKKSGADPKQIAQTELKLKSVKNALRNVKNSFTEVENTSDEANKQMKKDLIGKTAGALGEVNNMLGTIQDSFGDLMSDAGNTAMEVISSTLQVAQGIMSAISMTSTATADSIKAVERASVILAIISIVIQAITQITNAIMKNYSAHAKWKKGIEETEHALEGIQHDMQKVEHESKMMVGEESWKKLSGNAQNYKNQITLIKNEIKAAGEELARVNTQKKKDEVEDELRTWEEKLWEVEEEYQDFFNDFIEEFTGTTLKDFTSSLAESIVEGFNEGKNGIKESWDDMIKSLEREMLTNQLKRELEKQFKSAFEFMNSKLAGGATLNTGQYNVYGSIMTGDERDQFLSLIEQAEEGTMIIAERYKELFASMGLLDDTISAENKGFETMSQDTADELNGRFTALQITGANIENILRESILTDKQSLQFTQNISENMALVADISQQQLIQLREINTNTSLLRETNQRLKTIELNTSRL